MDGTPDNASLAAESAQLDVELLAADADLAPFTVGARYRANAPVVVRVGAAMDSAKAAAGKVAEGQDILVVRFSRIFAVIFGV